MELAAVSKHASSTLAKDTIGGRKTCVLSYTCRRSEKNHDEAADV